MSSVTMENPEQREELSRKADAQRIKDLRVQLSTMQRHHLSDSAMTLGDHRECPGDIESMLIPCTKRSRGKCARVASKFQQLSWVGHEV